MADISTININNVSYNIKDTTAREGVAGIVQDLVNYYTKSQVYNKTEINQIVSGIRQFEPIVVTTLPTASADTMYKLYLVPSEDPETENIKDEYITIATTTGGTTTYAWEKIGSTAIDLSAYSTTEEMNEAIATAVSDAMYDVAEMLEGYYTKEEVDDELEEKVGKGDYAPKLVSGAAGSILGIAKTQNFTFSRVPSGTGNGTALIETIKGQSLVWNQLANIVDGTGGGNGVVLTRSNGKITFSGTATARQAAALFGRSTWDSTHKFLINQHANGLTGVTMYSAGNVITMISGTYLRGVGTCNSSSFYMYYSVDNGVSPSGSVTPQLVDLTLLFGAGKEPSTVDEFEKWYDGIYPHDPGSILNLTATGMKMTGRNQWDEVWEEGNISTTTGEPTAATGVIRAKNFNKCFPATAYNVKLPTGADAVRVYWYDADQSFIRASVFSVANGLVQDSPSNAHYFKLIAAVSAYNNDICINLSDPTFNGQYEPYREDTIALNTTTIKGKRTGAINPLSEVIFPNGLCGVGDVHDALRKGDADVNFGIVDMGSLNYQRSNYSGNYLFTTSIIGKAVGMTNMVCPMYFVGDYAASQVPNLCMRGDINSAGFIYIRNDAYTDAATFKAAMSGVKLIYQLATPKHYILDEPLDMNILVGAGGTQGILPDQTQSVTSAPMVADIRYPQDTVHMVSSDSLVSLLEALKTANKISSYTMTWNNTTGKYDFTIS